MILLVIKWILLIVKVSESIIDTCEKNNITPTRVAKMCQSTTAVENDDDGNDTIDSVFLSLLEQENYCSCNISVKNVQTTINLNITRLNNLTEQPLCGIEIDIYFLRPNESNVPESFPIRCNSTEQTLRFSLFRNEYLQFTSRVEDGNFSIGYCVQILREHTQGDEDSFLEISCGNQALTTTTDSPTHPQTTISDTPTYPKTTLNDFWTSEQTTSIMSSPTPMVDVNDKTDSDGDSILYIAIGAGGGFVLCVSLLVVILLCKRRKSHHSGKEENSENGRANSTADDDDDSLKYNVLYASSERHDDIDVNYSTADGDIPRHISGDDEGGYSTVHDNKNIQDSSLNTHQVTNTALEFKEDGVEHINAPAEKWLCVCSCRQTS
ncbi:unnamed protein product [Mytilus coruscus]|uniref:CUB domain-containing protein n=1 Tax=Mytilus coruscus TaxID=42192 RepID=A0A6J8EDM8_MYTCO|nr:unnamed protein product [Mytilus coruscus]